MFPPQGSGSSGGGLSDGDKGDVTVGGSGTTLTIDNAAVTLAKIANIATDRVLGRDTAAAGVTEELTVGGGIEFTGTGGLQTSALTGDVTKSAGGTATTIAAGVVTYAKMQDVSATDKVLGRSTAGSGDVEEIACTAAGRALLDDATAADQRATLGVGTADSPQFAGVNVGDAGDTTITRTAAGSIAVEGNEIYRAGGTDVPVTDGGTGASTAAAARTNLGCDDLYARSINTRNRVYRSILTHNSNVTLVEDRAYFVYCGYTTQAVTPKYVECYVTTGGTGAQTAEVGIFSSTAAPNKSNQTLTKIEATGTVDDLGTQGVKRNTNAFSTSVAAGVHLWAGIRTAMATNEPAMVALLLDFAHGNAVSTDAAGALTGAGPWTGAIIAASVSTISPALTITLD